MRKVALLLLPALAALTVACGSGTTDTSGSNPTTSGATTTAAVGSGSTASTTAVKKVSANNASEQELVAALTAAGVSNPTRWAGEIQEYRPYDTSDASLSKLKQELAKYKPDQATLDKIMSVLEP